MQNHLIRRRTRKHYRSYFETFKNNSKKIWKGVNELINKTNSKSSKNIHLKDNGSTITDQKKVADRFNKYFTGIAQSLVNKLGKTKSKFTDYLKEPNVNSIFINPVNESEVYDQLATLDESTTADSYNIPVRLIKLIKNIITEPLTYFINLSFSSGCYPKLPKYGKIIPVFKANSQDQVNNYRPISLLPILNKICEKLMYVRL